MSAAPALVAAEDAEGSKPPPQWTFIATPNSTWWGSLTDTYSLSSTPAGDDETLPKTITVTWTDNLKTILTTTGTGAATGFMFGPIGGAVGAGIGLAAGVFSSSDSKLAGLLGKTKRLPTEAQEKFSDYVCARDKGKPEEDGVINVNYDKIPFSRLSPQLGLPVVLKPGPASDFYTVKPEAHGCWHPVPNNVALAVGSINSDKSRDPQQGDGWFYRIVAKSPAPTDAAVRSTEERLVGPTKKEDWFDLATKTPVNRFPVSNCEHVTLQFTWWQEIAQHSSDGKLRVWHQDTEIANPEVIRSVKIPKSGTINFRLSCGAYATNSFSATPVSDRITQLDALVQTLMKAQTSNQATSAKAGAAPAKPPAK